jgi:hypothetical protein
MQKRLLVKYPFLDLFSKNNQVSRFIKKRSVGAEFFHADGRTDRQTDTNDDANSSFSHFCQQA